VLSAGMKREAIAVQAKFWKQNVQTLEIWADILK
jgi:hypothetical protein